MACLSFPLKNKRSTENTCFYGNNKFKGDASIPANVDTGERRGDRLAHVEKIGLGSTLSFFSYHFNPHLNLYRIKGFGGKKCMKKINNAPRNIICTSPKREE